MRFFLFCVLILLGFPAYAQVRTVQVSPQNSEFTIRTYGIGFLPVDSRITSFQGTFTYDLTNRARCEATLTAAVASLVTSSASVRDIVLGPEFFDAAHYPSLHYAGRCEGSDMVGSLTLRGLTHLFRLKLTWEPHLVTARGDLSRKEWGMTGKPLLVGDTIRVRVSTKLP